MVGGSGHSFKNQTSSGADTGAVTIGGLNFGKSQTSFADVGKYAVIGGLALLAYKLFLTKGKK